MGGASGSLCSDEFVDAGAQVLEYEILIGCCLSIVDFLSPLLKGKLDAKGFINGKGNIEKVQAVDTEIINSMTFRRD